MTFPLAIILISAVISTFFGIFVFIKNSRSITHFLFTLAAFSMALWGYLMAIFEISVPQSTLFYFSGLWLYLA